jgi:hypothetical protein
VEQEEQNTGHSIPYETFVIIHGSRNHKNLHSHGSFPDR